MRFVFKIGPLPMRDGEGSAFFVHPPEGSKFASLGATDLEGLEQVATLYIPEDLECEPALAAAAAQFGIRPGVITPERAHIIGLRAFDLALPHHYDAVKREGIIYQFGLASSQFWRASPWRYDFAQRPIHVSLSGNRGSTFEAMVLGGELQYGLFLYPQAGSVRRAIELAHEGALEEAARIDSIGVTFQDSPDFAVDAMQRSYDLPRLPVPTRITNGSGVPLEDLDLLSIATALSAVSYMTNTQTIGISRITVGDLEVEATATAAPNTPDTQS
jgi:hypothetical protein